jgi:hypothetical protein
MTKLLYIIAQESFITQQRKTQRRGAVVPGSNLGLKIGYPNCLWFSQSLKENIGIVP